MKSEFNILDTVALLVDIPERGLLKGQVGTIVEVLQANVFEIEFIDKSGQTIALLSIDSSRLLLLHYETQLH